MNKIQAKGFLDYTIMSDRSMSHDKFEAKPWITCNLTQPLLILPMVYHVHFDCKSFSLNHVGYIWGHSAGSPQFHNLKKSLIYSVYLHLPDTCSASISNCEWRQAMCWSSEILNNSTVNNLQRYRCIIKNNLVKLTHKKESGYFVSHKTFTIKENRNFRIYT